MIATSSALLVVSGLASLAFLRGSTATADQTSGATGSTAGSTGSIPAPTGSTGSSLAAQKAAVLQQQAAAAKAAPEASPSTVEAGIPPAAPLSIPPSAVSNQAQAPFPRSFFLANNSWSGQMGTNWVTVYAGETGPAYRLPTSLTASSAVSSSGAQSDVTSTSVGVPAVVVFSEPVAQLSISPDLGSPQVVLDPTANGPLQVSQMTGNVLTLQDAAGVAHSFSLSTQRFQS